jgi:hypothetical protein
MAQICLGGMVFGKNPVIKRVQYITKALDVHEVETDTATIPIAVNPDNTVLIACGKSPTMKNAQSINARFELTNSTTITFTTGNGTGILTFVIAVIEFHPGIVKSKQTGTILLTDDEETGTDTINPVVIAKSLLVDNGADLSGVGSEVDAILPYFELTDTTTVTVTRDNPTNDMTGAYTVVEFY